MMSANSCFAAALTSAVSRRQERSVLKNMKLTNWRAGAAAASRAGWVCGSVMVVMRRILARRCGKNPIIRSNAIRRIAIFSSHGRKYTHLHELHESVTAIKTAASCQEACGNCNPSWAVAQNLRLWMCLISAKRNAYSSYANTPTELCKAVRSAHLARYFDFYTGLSAAFSAEAEETYGAVRSAANSSAVNQRHVES